MTARGVFVTGTDTGVGKTVVAACLVRAWHACYWKPLQTGLAIEPGDTDTVRVLAGVLPERLLSPLYALQAPLSPEAAARLENVTIAARDIRLPDTAIAAATVPLVVEGAGGLMVPIAPGEMMVDLIARLALPVVLVARGTLGTINHTLLSLEALRRRAIPVAGVVLNGDGTEANREAIERHGHVRIIAELPRLACLESATLAELSRRVPPFSSIF